MRVRRSTPELLDAINARIDVMASEIEANGAKIEEVAVAPRDDAGDERLTEMAAELMVARNETDQARKGIEDLREDLRGLREYAATARTEATAAMETAAAARSAGTAGEQQIDELRSDVADLLAMLQEFKAGFEESRQAAVAARRDAEQARVVAENVGSQNQVATERFTEVWRDILNLGPGGAGAEVTAAKGQARRPGKKARADEAPARDPRPGFDDAPTPMAILEPRRSLHRAQPVLLQARWLQRGRVHARGVAVGA